MKINEFFGMLDKIGIKGADIDTLAIEKDLLERIVNGDKDAIQEAREKFDGIQLYYHFLSTYPNEVFITLSQACELGIVDTVRIENEAKKEEINT